MSTEHSPEKLIALPVQVAEVDGGVILKRGRIQIKISGSYAGEAVRLVLATAVGEGSNRDEILQLFAPLERPTVLVLIEHLINKRILVTELDVQNAVGDDESALSIFYWHFGVREQEASRRLNDQRFKIIGVNVISRQLAVSLKRAGINNLDVLDYAPLRNFRFFDDDGMLMDAEWPTFLQAPSELSGGAAQLDAESVDCLIATSDSAGSAPMREFNEFCVRHGRLFFPIVLQDLIGHVGPLVVSGETACLECFRARQNAHATDLDAQLEVESAVFAGQSKAAFLPSMASILGDIAAVELIKFFGLGPPLSRVGTVITVNLLASEMTTRKVLRVPRCPICSPLIVRASTSTIKKVFI